MIIFLIDNIVCLNISLINHYGKLIGKKIVN